MANDTVWGYKGLDMKISSHLKAKIAIGLGAIISAMVLVKLYIWVYEAILKIFVDQTINWVMPLLPFGRDLGGFAMHATATVLFTSILLVVAYFIGSMASTFGGKLFQAILGKYISKIPGYGILSNVVNNFIEGGGTKQFSRFGLAYHRAPGCGPLTGHSMPVIITGESETHFSVMTPSAPTPMTGFMYFYPKEQVVEIDMEASEFFSHVVGLGTGSLIMLEKIKTPKENSEGE